MTSKLLDPQKWQEQADFVRSLRRYMGADAAQSLETLAARLESMGERRRAHQLAQSSAAADRAPHAPETH